MANDNLKTSVYSRIEDIAKASTSLKALLAVASRELLEYVPETKDIGAVNRLLSVLNKGDRAMCVAFFKAMLPWQYHNEKLEFTTMLPSETRRKNMFTKVTEFLKDADNNVFTWSRPARNQAPRKVDFRKNLVNLVKRATSEDTPEHINKKDVFDVLLAELGIDLVMSLAAKAVEVRKAEVEKAEKAKAMAEKRDAEAGRAKPAAKKTPAKVAA